MITVVNMKSIGKYLLLAGILIIIGMSAKHFQNIKNTSIEQKMIEQLGKYSFIGCIEETLPDIEGKNIEKAKQVAVTTRGSSVRRILNQQLPMLEQFSEEDLEEETEELQLETSGNSETLENVNQAQTGMQTQEIKENNIEGKYTDTYGSVKVRNQTKYQLTEEILKPDFELENKKALIVIGV